MGHQSTHIGPCTESQLCQNEARKRRGFRTHMALGLLHLTIQVFWFWSRRMRQFMGRVDDGVPLCRQASFPCSQQPEYAPLPSSFLWLLLSMMVGMSGGQAWSHVFQNMGSKLQAFHSHRDSRFSRNDFFSLFSLMWNLRWPRRIGREETWSWIPCCQGALKIQPWSFKSKFKPLKTSWFPFWVMGHFVTFKGAVVKLWGLQNSGGFFAAELPDGFSTPGFKDFP